MTNVKLKKIIRKIYNLNYDNVTLRDNDEFIVHTNGVSEFNSFFKKFDLKEGIIVSPVNYKKGLFFSIANKGEIYSSSRCSPEITKFAFDIAGLKKDYFYRITVLARDTDNYNVVTSDRTLTVSDNTNTLIIEKDLKGFDTNQICVGFVRPTSSEISLFFSIGKIIIKDIIIEEVLLEEEENLTSSEDLTEIVPENKEKLVGYAVFDLKPIVSSSYTGRFKPLHKLYGKGLSLVFDTTTNTYILERSNLDNVLEESFTNIPYKIEFNFNKVPNDGIFTSYNIIKYSNDISPTMLKQGYLEFALLNGKEKISYNGENSRFYVNIYKIK